MTIEEADKIVTIWGKHLEYCSRLLIVFGGKIPESLLPFPKSILMDAITIVIQEHVKRGNEQAVNTLLETMSILTAYVNDEQAILSASEDFRNSKWREATLPALKKSQKEWIETQDI